MGGWQHRIAPAAERIEHVLDRARRRAKRRLGLRDPIVIAPYIGYGTRERFRLHGRVLEDEQVRSPVEGDSIWDNLRIMYRRFESDEIPGAKVEARVGEQTCLLKTDRDGFFRTTLDLKQPIQTDSFWHDVRYRLLEPLQDTDHAGIRVTGKVIVPSKARFGVISDIDDTVIHTDTRSLVKMARIVYLNNARTRLPFAGVTEFYHALHCGVSGAERNPIFYVSSSPWNLYDLFHDFLEIQNIPLGPLMLRDWGISTNELLPTGHKDYKLNTIRRILDFYPDMRFLLIGDSGQEDPEIYLHLVEEYPGRIPGAYIRQVTGRESRLRTIRELFDRAATSGTDLEVVPDTLAAARHAAERGWIPQSAIEKVEAEVRRDKAQAESESDIVSDRKDR